jgi:hypothetical protein
VRSPTQPLPHNLIVMNKNRDARISRTKRREECTVRAQPKAAERLLLVSDSRRMAGISARPCAS